jgi:hypothetical protein
MRNLLLKGLLALLLVSVATCSQNELADFSEFMTGHNVGSSTPANPPVKTSAPIAIASLPTGYISRPARNTNNPQFMDITVDAELIQPFFSGSADKSVYLKYFDDVTSQSKLRNANVQKPQDALIFGLKMHKFTKAEHLIAAIKATSQPNTRLRASIRMNCKNVYPTIVVIRRFRNTSVGNSLNQQLWNSLMHNLNIASMLGCSQTMSKDIMDSTTRY